MGNKITINKALICVMVIGVSVSSCTLRSKRNCRKSFFSPLSDAPSSLAVLFFIFRSMMESITCSAERKALFICRSTPCISNPASVGKKSEMFGFPNNSVISDAASRNSAPILPSLWASGVLPHKELSVTLTTVWNDSWPMSIGVPILEYALVIAFLTSDL